MSLMIIQHSARLLQYADIMFASILIYITASNTRGYNDYG